MGQLSEIPRECLQKTKNTSIYSPNWTKPSDRCVRLYQRFRLNASLVKRYAYIAISDLGWTLQIYPRDVRYKTHEMAHVGSRSNAPDAFDRVKSWPL